MRNLVTTTIGDTKLPREFYGIHRAISGRMLKYEIYIDDCHVFEEISYCTLIITVITTKKKVVHNLPEYFKGVLDKLVDERYFKDIFMLLNMPVEGFYCP